MAIGLRVIRGPDWNLGNIDGGDNHLGTVTEVVTSTKVKVTWDLGGTTSCRVGENGKYDIRVIDNATIGVIHEGITCSRCNDVGISGVRWHCNVCNDVNLCSLCYYRGAHDEKHAFSRIDYPGSKPVTIPKRSISQRARALGLFPGATVTRGPDWEYGNQDGGQEGTVEDILTWGGSMTERDAARVCWKSGKSNVYRLGFDGKVDMVCKEKAPGPDFYPDHLGVLDMADLNRWKKSCSILKLGDKVCIKVSKSELRKIQEAHKNWKPKMEMLVGGVGEIRKFTPAGDIKIQFEQGIFTLNKAAIQKVSALKVWDLVRVLDNADTVQRLQGNHGGWDDDMKEVLGKVGTVVHMDKDGDMAVRFGDVVFVFNPACLQLVTGENEFKVKKVNMDSLYGSGSDAIDDDTKSTFGDTDTQGHNNDSDSDDSESDEDGQLTLFDESSSDDDNDDGDKLAQILAGLLLLGGGLKMNVPVQDDQEYRKQFVQHLTMGDAASVKSMLQKKPDLIRTTYNNVTMLTLATCKGYVEIIGILLDAGANINYTDDRQMAALLIATKMEKGDVAKYLIERGANVNIINFQNRTALHFAALKCMISTVKLLLARGCNVNAQDKDGDTALHDAIGAQKEAVIDILVQHSKTDLWLKNNKDFNVLAFACFKGNDYAVDKLTSRLPALATSETTMTHQGHYPLHIAAANDHTTEAALLLTRCKADVNIRSNDGFSALHQAAKYGYFDMTKLLLENGADCNAKTNEGETALYLCLHERRVGLNLFGVFGSLAEEAGRVKVATLLIEHGADITITNKNGQSPLAACWSPRMKEAVTKVLQQHTPGSAHGASDGCALGSLGRDAFASSIQKCILCTAQPAGVRYMPCGHKVTCEMCQDRCRVCPICQEIIIHRFDQDDNLIIGENCVVS